MEFHKITAVIPVNALAPVEVALEARGALDMSVTHVKGYGGYKNFFDSHGTAEEVKLEIFAAGSAVSALVDCIIQTAHTGMDSDGYIAVLPVTGFYSIRDRRAL